MTTKSRGPLSAPIADTASAYCSRAGSTSVSAVEIAAQRWSADGVRLLLARGLNVRSVGVSGALTAAAANACEPVIVLLLDAGADVNAPDRARDTPLAMAQRTNHAEIARLLVARGARD